MRNHFLSLLAVTLLTACGSGRESGESVHNPDKETINPDDWPAQDSVFVRDPEMEERIAALVSRMTLEEKVGQVIQADISTVTPDQVQEYNLGAVLNGGGSAPGGDNRTTPDKWLALADEFWQASTDTSDGGVGIPVIWGTDAVHGHSNVLGATLFPHNIGLGMTNDPDLVYEIGRATALEVRVTGLDWTFAPTLAIARNDRWGRTYESFSEDPGLVTTYAVRMVEGLQGIVGTDEFLDASRVLACPKHFVGDGGTTDGRDQGDVAVTEAGLRDIHAVGYPPAILAGAQTVMASYNSFHGRKMHGDKAMLTDVLVGRMGFDGFVIGDWNGHGQVEGCSNVSCPASINAGLDMFMAPDSWDKLYATTLAAVQSGEISMARLDEAVSRVLRVKMRAGVFAAGLPSSRPYAGDFALLGNAEHRAIARDAVRKSLVLLKNEDGLLPLLPNMSVLVAGDGAHNIGKQAGGWTLNWQGSGNLNEHFPNGMSIYDGLKEVLEAGGGTAILSEDGSFTEAPDVAIVVFGEDPYAEFEGDRPSVEYADNDGLELLRKFQAAGIPAVSVFMSGRPLWVNPEINASTAFVAAWLPGSEGGGIADVLVGNADGSPRFDFRGRLSFSWPRTAADAAVNVGDDNYNPLFAFGHGLGFADDGSVAMLSEDPGRPDEIPQGLILADGEPAGTRRVLAVDDAGFNWIANLRGASGTGAVRVMPAERDRQADSMIATWSGAATIAVVGPPEDFTRESAGDMALQLEYRVQSSGKAAVQIGMGNGPGSSALVDVTDTLAKRSGTGWQTGYIRLSCFEDAGLDMASVRNPLVITAGAGLVMQLESAEVVVNPGDAGCAL